MHIVPPSDFGPPKKVKSEKVETKRRINTIITEDDHILARSNRPYKSIESEMSRKKKM